MILKTTVIEDSLSIKVFFGAVLGNINDDAILSAFLNEEDFVLIAEDNGRMNGEKYLEGELLFNTDIGKRVMIDLDGTLNITDEDSHRYFINEMGELIKNIY